MRFVVIHILICWRFGKRINHFRQIEYTLGGPKGFLNSELCTNEVQLKINQASLSHWTNINNLPLSVHGECALFSVHRLTFIWNCIATELAGILFLRYFWTLNPNPVSKNGHPPQFLSLFSQIWWLFPWKCHFLQKLMRNGKFLTLDSNSAFIIAPRLTAHMTFDDFRWHICKNSNVQNQSIQTVILQVFWGRWVRICHQILVTIAVSKIEHISHGRKVAS